MSEPLKQLVVDLPDRIPVMPLHGVLLLPKGQLPLNIFEKHYLDMVEDAMRTNRIIGMIQPDYRENAQQLFKTGCAGKITAFQETEDGRYLITLTGVSRFRVAEELDVTTGYRQIVPDWSEYRHDLDAPVINGFDRERLLKLLKYYFDLHDMTCSWDHVEKAPEDKLITSLAMICPFDAYEKQMLLEAPDSDDRAAKLMAILEIAVKCADIGSCTGKCH
jgi:hypothetical protein